MKRRHHARSVGAFLSWSERRPSAARARSKRLSVDRLESRCLLATVAEFGLPSGAGATPDGVTAGPGNSIWFTEDGPDKIGTINPVTHAISEFQVPTPNAEPFRITLGPDGNLWFTESNVGKIGMINPGTGKFTEYPLSSANSQPFAITAGPNHTVWFTEWSGNAIGSIDTQTGKVSEYAIPTLDSVPEGITVGSDGNVWFTESQANQIAMFDPKTLQFVGHPLPSSAAEPYGITAGPHGNLYFTEYTGNQIGVYSPSTSSFLKSISIPASDTQPTEITSAPGGKLWFTQSNTNQVAVLDPATQAITEFTTPSFESGPRGIAAASDGSIWFAELNSGKMATIAPGLQLVVTASPPLAMKLRESFSVTVAVEFDSGGAVDTSYDGTVSLALLSAPSGGSLLGSTTVMAVNGIATFSGLSLVHPGSFTIEVNSGTAAPADIGPINVTGPVGSSPVNPRVNPPFAPQVLSEQLVMAGKGKNRYVAGILLTFSSTLDPTTAGNSSNYSVVQATSAGRAKALKSIRLHVKYKPAKDVVKLTFAGRPRFTAGGQLRLTATGPTGISSASGVALEGNTGDGPGANALYRILPDATGIAG